MSTGRMSDVIENWPDPSREAAQLVVDKYGEPYPDGRVLSYEDLERAASESR